MAETSFRDVLVKGLDDLHITIDERAVERLTVYFRELKKWGRRINLISMGGDDRQIIENHFIDSLAMLPLVQGEGVHLLDIGTGAGFPGLVLKTAAPGMRATLVEPRLKRVSFLRHIVRTLELQDVAVLSCRVEDERQLPSDIGATHVTSRAVTEIDGFLEMIARFAQNGARVICMKGPKWREELLQAQSALQTLSLQVQTSSTYTLPFSGAARALIVLVPPGTAS